ncbi:type II toxin-antitoxin system toxin endoribonuclease MazF3 [Isoptericola hypogeus]|uniref:Type II toxin-antitoxin system toxin endoribonuclease MazF3 n=1 Tax=Isoptericola hypogeus TaxID=300179 RepID=A0ABN2IPX3_9MICO
MRPIHLVRLDKTRPAVVLTREPVRSRRRWVSVAPIKSKALGLATEVLVDERNGIEHGSAVDCDSIQTVLVDDVGRQVGFLLDGQEEDLARAISTAFDLADFGPL